MRDGLWSIVDGSEAAPTSREQLVKYNIRKDKALATIVLAVETSLLYLLGEPTEPKEAWETLERQFQRKSWANKLHLRRKLYSMKLKDDQPVQDHVKLMTEVFNELAVIGDPVDEDDRVVHLLASLPEKFNMLVTAFEASEKVPTMETVIERLLHEELKRVHGESMESQVETGLHLKTKRGPVCYKCKAIGHIKRNRIPSEEESTMRIQHRRKQTAITRYLLSHIML